MTLPHRLSVSILAMVLWAVAGSAHAGDADIEEDADIAAELAEDAGGYSDVAVDPSAPPQITPGDGLSVSVPSGQAITLQDVIWNVPGTDGLATRFRFLAPGIAAGGGVDFDSASADMQALCDGFALPRVVSNNPPPTQIIISLSAAPVPFGEAAPDVAQFFESYRIEDGSCRWEMF